MDEKAVRELLAGSTGGGTNEMTSAEKTRLLMARDTGQNVQYGNFVQRNLQGLPIDTEKGAPAWVKFNVAWRDKPESKLAYLEEVYGKGNARLADTGEALIKVIDEKGQAKEIKVDEDRLTKSDLATLAADVPEFAAGIGALVAGRYIPGTQNVPFLRRAPVLRPGVSRDVIAQTVGAELGGLAAKDIATENMPLTQAALERAKALPGSAAMGGAMEVGARALGVFSPFARTKDLIAQQGASGRKALRQRFNVALTETAGEKTGNPMVRRIEATAARLPGGMSQAKDLRVERTQDLGRIQNQMLGLPADATPEQRLARMNEEGVGEEATAAIQKAVSPQQEAVESAAGKVQTSATADVMDEAATSAMTSRSLQGLPGAARELEPEFVGAAIRERALAERQAFQTESSRLYEQVRNLPGGSDRIFADAGLVAEAKKIKESLPPKTKITEEPIGVTGPGGHPITKTVTGTEASKEFVPSDVIGRLNEIIDHPKTLRSLEDLKQMRTDVANAIAQGEAIPGVQTHYLNRIRKAISDEMDRVVNSMPDGKLKAAWEEANAYHRKNVGKFEESNIARLFKDIESRGFVKNEDIVRSLGASEYSSFKKFLGEASPEFQSLKRSIVDTVIQSATPLDGGVIDGTALVSKLKAMRDNNKSVFDDTFGPRTRNFQQLADILQTGNAKVDEAKFRELIASGTPTGEAVRALVQEQRKLDKLYQSQLIKDIANRTVGDAGFDATEFVNRFYDTAKIKDVRAVIEQLHDQPEVLERVRRAIIEKIFYRAQRAAADVDPSNLGRGELFRPPNSNALQTVFGEEANKEKLELILGRQTYQDFDNLAKYLRGSTVSEQAFAGAGGMSATMQVTDMFRHGPFSYMTDYLKQKAYAITMSAAPVRAILSNRWMGPQNMARIGTTLLVSKPFIERMQEDFGDETLIAMQMMKDSLDFWSSKQSAPQSESPEERARAILGSAK